MQENTYLQRLLCGGGGVRWVGGGAGFVEEGEKRSLERVSEVLP